MKNFDKVTLRLSGEFSGILPAYTTGLCNAAKAAEVEAFFSPRIQKLPGGPRRLAQALEEIRICAAKVDAQKQSAQRFFSSFSK